jgi:hypothetical protein
MSIIPNKNLYIVTSALKIVMGVFTYEERFEQTLKTFESIRKKDPNSIILLLDISLEPLPEEHRKILNETVDIYFDLSNNPDVRKCTEHRLKNLSETVSLLNCLFQLKANPEMQKIMYSVKRVFKITGRGELEDDFDITVYDDPKLFGKFVFAKRLPTWMPEVKRGATDLLRTRLLSFCPSLLDTYFNVLQQLPPLLNEMDFEHAHFITIPSETLVEFDRVCMKCMVASTGVWHYD